MSRLEPLALVAPVLAAVAAVVRPVLDPSLLLAKSAALPVPGFGIPGGMRRERPPR